jgi:hypothetical protein
MPSETNEQFELVFRQRGLFMVDEMHPNAAGEFGEASVGHGRVTAKVPLHVALNAADLFLDHSRPSSMRPAASG